MIVTVDIIPFRLSGCADKGLEVLLIKRSNPNRPYHGVWALPGGFVFDKDLTSEGGRPADENFEAARDAFAARKFIPILVTSAKRLSTVILSAIRKIGA